MFDQLQLQQSHCLRIREGMTLNKGDRVEVYYNIVKGGIFSIKSLVKGTCYGKVVAYAPTVLMSNGKFVVSKPGIEKIRSEQRKRVCAVVRGTFEGIGSPINGEKVYFNPYITDLFTRASDGVEVHSAEMIYFYNNICEVH